MVEASAISANWAEARVARKPRSRKVALATLFLASHVVLALVMHRFPVVATVHAVVAFGAALFVASTTTNMKRIALWTSYLAGSEVLWRMLKSGLFWEFGKYSVAAVLVVGLLRTRGRQNRGLALAYFALLLPSVALTVGELDLESMRQDLSFYLSGPLALMLAVLFFSRIRMTAEELLGSFLAFIGPIVSIATLSFLSTTAADDVEFVNAANSVTSGGFGPNQVAAVLGLGAMMIVLIVVGKRLAWTTRAPLLGLAAALTAQSALTFARGGVALAFAGACGAMFIQLRNNRRARVTVLAIAVIGYVVGTYAIAPRLEDFTKGKIGERYDSTKTSGRDTFIEAELTDFKDHPLLGVGLGMGAHLRREEGVFMGASHTEYSRMLGEHGIFGAFSFICLFVLAVRAIRDARTPNSRSIAVAMVIWVALFLLIYGMRVVAPSLVFGLAFVTRSNPQKRAAIV